MQQVSSQPSTLSRQEISPHRGNHLPPAGGAGTQAARRPARCGLLPALSMGPLSLRLNFSWTLFGNLAQAVCRYATLILLVHLCGLEAAGLYALAMALCTPIWSLALLGLRGALTTDARNEFAFADYLAVRWISSAVAMIAIAATVLLGGYGRDAVAIILLVAAAKFFENLSDIFHGRLQQHERMDWVAVAMAIRGLGGVALMFPAAVLIGSPAAVVAAFPLAMGATFLFWDLPCAAVFDRASGPCAPRAAFWRTPLRPPVLGRLSIVALPIAISGFLVALIPQLPKYVIGSLLGAESVAVYTLIAYWITLGMTIVTALGNTVTPRLARYYAAGEDRAFASLLARIMLLVAAMGAAGVIAALGLPLLGEDLLARLGPGVADLPRVVLSLSVFAAMLYLTGPLGRALNAMRRFWGQVATRCVGIALALALLPPMVGARGLAGAADAMAISAAVVAGLFFLNVWKLLAIRAGERAPLWTGKAA
jgi:O-antigen/teichoic acid export membrane protein